MVSESAHLQAEPVTRPAEDPVVAPLLAISNAMVHLYKEAFGRGPTKVRTRFAGPDVLVIFLESALTVAERNLVALGEHARLRESRLVMHHALETRFRAVVERALDRRTLTFVSGIDTERDVSVEVFTLEARREPHGAAVGDGIALSEQADGRRRGLNLA